MALHIWRDRGTLEYLMEPKEWNIVVAGAWNRAILTPAWIQSNIFELPEGSNAEILVPLDGFAPFQFRNAGLTVVPAPGQILYQLAESTVESLTKAMSAAKRAIEQLPRTPLRACGINLRFSSEEPPEDLLRNMRCETEKIFSDANYELQILRRGETLVYKDGLLNVIADIRTTGPCTVALNFHCESTDKDRILDWLARNPSEYITEAEKVIGLIS